MSSACQLKVQQFRLSHLHNLKVNHGRFFCIEGVQASKHTLKDTTKLDGADISQQGVQKGGQSHTGSQNGNSSSNNGTGTKSMTWDFEEVSAPQGVQGYADNDSNCGYFNTWLENCRRYGMANCDQQLQGIQSGRLTLAQVLAEQQAMIAEIAANYRKRSQDVQNESFQGAQGNLELPDISAPCPQGVQGDDCVRFKLWLENCHRFGLHDCGQQLQGLQSGRLTLAQLFAQQDEVITKVAQLYQKQVRSNTTQPRGQNQHGEKAAAEDAQVGGTGGGTVDGTLPQLSQREKLKRAVKEYGATVIVFHITISLASLGGFYLAVSSGIDMVGILKTIGVGEAILQSKLATGTGTFVVAYAVHKVFAPVRIGITLTATPFIVRYLRSKGILKPPKAKKL